MEKKESILVICAHSDDQIFGAGGTLANYSKEKANIFTVIFSHGQGSHPWLKEKVTIKMRVKEAKAADKVIGGNGVMFCGFNELKIEEDFKRRRFKSKLIYIIKKNKPTKIFMHSIDDPHPDHQAVNKIVLDAVDSMKEKIEVYCFDIWNPWIVKYRNHPKMVVDISDTLKVKIKALNCFKSQFVALLTLMPSVYVKAFFSGIQYNLRFAEVFVKVR